MSPVHYNVVLHTLQKLRWEQTNFGLKDKDNVLKTQLTYFSLFHIIVTTIRILVLAIIEKSIITIIDDTYNNF